MNRMTPQGLAELAKIRDEIKALKAATIAHVKVSIDKIMGL